MTESPNNDLIAPPLLEQLGALCSLLIHDLANHLCIISGSATFAQMVVNEPERVAHSLKAIVQAGENAAHALGSCGELRRALPETVRPSEVHQVLAELETTMTNRPGWALEIEPGLSGRVRLPAIWVSFAVQCLIKETRVTGGAIRVGRVRATAEIHGDSSDTPAAAVDSSLLRVALAYSADEPFQIKEIRTRYDHLGLLAAFELNRCLGGRIDSRTPAPGQQEVWLDLPAAANDS
jgi:hypothetical protein